MSNKEMQPTNNPNWLAIIAKIAVYALGLIAAAYGVQAAASIM